MREVLSARSSERPSCPKCQASLWVIVPSAMPTNCCEASFTALRNACGARAMLSRSTSSARRKWKRLTCSHISLEMTSRICRALSRARCTQLTMELG